MRRVTVVIPAYNEAARIATTIGAVYSIPEVNEVIVVDDASRDETARVASNAGAKVVRLPRNSGKGAALNKGVALASGDVVVLLDGDLGESAREARALILPVLEGEVDMTVARFPETGRKAGFGLVKGLARAGIRYFTGLEVTAPLSGQRALTREVLKAVLPFARGYGVEVALTIRAAKRGFRLKEIPVAMHHRETGKDLRGFLHRGRQFRDVLLTLGRLFFEFKQLGRVGG